MKICVISSLLLLTSMTASFAAFATDSDFDGVEDAIDKCPDTAQLKKVNKDFRYRMVVNPERLQKSVQAYPVDPNGCELDDDGDGVVNSKDYCPENTPLELSKGISANGCPRHSDQDGVPDYRDRCPGTAAGQKSDRFGCPIHTP
ncbi:thrombospondin type 3 repeat-containing protein [Thiomicrorhabdus xiamenensis]|uniref:Thrombospondin type 3 repeat-containing protein n=1 Tax=Thiomicrorhabdus xiamenensis TaxID=2739063 RepID=A0A7D4P4L3_9GAMM|nr:thrombospondin type 3 repeat-containing protein [Thiomicrorhabdus xiamenensis]QKI89336.1 thrombospondin type 3 repeat-containing protein [Thiomicrorhabdus xiamenensis]